MVGSFVRMSRPTDGCMGGGYEEGGWGSDKGDRVGWGWIAVV